MPKWNAYFVLLSCLAAAEPLGIISVGTQATNLAFAGKDGKTLYITTHASLFKVRMLAQRYRGRAK